MSPRSRGRAGIARRVVGYAALGLATSFAVAWGCEAAFRFLDESMETAWEVTGDHYGVVTLHAPGRRAYLVDYGTSVDPGSSEYPDIPAGARPGELPEHLPRWVPIPDPVLEDAGWREIATSGAGWPCVCMVHEFWSDRVVTPTGVQKVSGERWTAHLQLPWKPKGLDDFSLLPNPVGLAIDTGFWGGAWWGGLMLVGLAKRRWRRRRGHCAHCGYDLADSPGACPECGRAVPAR